MPGALFVATVARVLGRELAQKNYLTKDAEANLRYVLPILVKAFKARKKAIAAFEKEMSKTIDIPARPTKRKRGA